MIFFLLCFKGFKKLLCQYLDTIKTLNLSSKHTEVSSYSSLLCVVQTFGFILIKKTNTKKFQIFSLQRKKEEEAAAKKKLNISILFKRNKQKICNVLNWNVNKIKLSDVWSLTRGPETKKVHSKVATKNPSMNICFNLRKKSYL